MVFAVYRSLCVTMLQYEVSDGSVLGFIGINQELAEFGLLCTSWVSSKPITYN